MESLSPLVVTGPAAAVEAERVYVYMRDEYPSVLKILADEIAALAEIAAANAILAELSAHDGATSSDVSAAR